MSYDIELQIDTGGEWPATIEDIGNMTSNVSPMWSKALGFPLADLHGRIAGTVLDDLRRAIQHINDPAHVEVYEALEPDNGWGSRKGAAQYLGKLLDACQRHPNCTIEISR
jgi:hypothetical protein